HHPKARSYLKEYVLHRFFEREDVLTPRYDFIDVSVNGKSRGVFAFEEHFEKILVEAKKRREGPILKMTEDGFWAGVKRQMQQVDGIDNDIEQSVRLMETSDIQAFKQSKTMKSKTLAKQFKIAQNLLYQYRYGLKRAEDIFDIERLAKFYAICDVMGAYHGLAWHNQRFYYNPVLSKLEPIGFDGFGSSSSKRNSILGQGALNPRKLNVERMENKLFMNPVFTDKYIRYLYAYTSNEYIEAFVAEIEKELEDRELLLRTEFKNYRFNQEDFVRNVRRVGTLMLPYDNLSVKAYANKSENGQQYLRVANTHDLPVELVGYGPKSEEMTATLNEPMLLEGFLPRKLLAWSNDVQHSEKPLEIFKYSKNRAAHMEQHFLNYEPLVVKESTRYLFFRPLGIDSLFHCPIFKWEAPYNDVPAQNLFADAQPASNDWMTVDGPMVYIKKGKHRIAENIIIPEGYHVYFEAGTELDLVQKAAFISRSPVFMNGTEEDGILIHSSDRSANGFTVLQAGEASKMHFVTFDHMNTLSKEGWTLTGAVSFYESDVNIENCTFKNNHCEDGLNIIRSEFTIAKSLISYTASDGLDADFCKGTIESCRFYETGNDAMDFSGSVMMIKSCRAENVGDKGLSVGEDSDATVYQLFVDKAVIGVASKDLSLLVVDGLTLSNCSQGFAAYQKKPEYGGSKIIVNSYQAKGVRRLHNIRKGCTLQLKDQTIEGEL
ncbi:MAG: right-handed parallel beta-helix repeat-containing protein, partial [Bacteroidota bacterium]